MFEKFYRIGVMVLLALILGVQAYAQFKPQPQPTEKCLAAVKEANATISSAQVILNNSLALYKKGVYDQASNINQQQFMALESIFTLQHSLGEITAATANVEMECR